MRTTNTATIVKTGNNVAKNALLAGILWNFESPLTLRYQLHKKNTKFIKGSQKKTTKGVVPYTYAL